MTSPDTAPTSVRPASPVDSHLAGGDAQISRYLDAALEANTRIAYAADLAAWTRWCDGNAATPLPADPLLLARHLAGMADRGLAVATIERRLAAISRAHRDAGHPSPSHHPGVSRLLEGIRRTHGTHPTNRKQALSTEEIRRLLAAIDQAHRLSTAKQLRDRAIVLLGFAGGMRRSELAGLDLEHLQTREDGLAVTIVKSKTDQTGTGRQVGIAYGTHPNTCPVSAVRHWQHHTGHTTGPLFRSISRHGHIAQDRLTGRSIARILKHWALAAGLDHTRIAGHSLRAGHATTAAANGAADRTIMATTGHQDRRTLDTYIRPATLLNNPSSAHLDL